jgi:hypothetical protein
MAPRPWCALLTLALCGCFSAYRIRPSEISHLDGYDIHNERSALVLTGIYAPMGQPGGGPIVTPVPVTDRPYRMIDEDGDVHDFSAATELFVGTPAGKVGGKWWSIKVTEAALRGQLSTGQVVDVPRQQLQSVELKQLSVGRTVLFCVLVSLVASAVAITGGFILASAGD